MRYKLTRNLSDEQVLLYPNGAILAPVGGCEEMDDGTAEMIATVLNRLQDELDAARAELSEARAERDECRAELDKARAELDTVLVDFQAVSSRGLCYAQLGPRGEPPAEAPEDDALAAMRRKRNKWRRRVRAVIKYCELMLTEDPLDNRAKGVNYYVCRRVLGILKES